MATKYPIGIQSFEKLITEGFAYVDKTEFVNKLVSASGYYFLSRPRRFGKSLFLSTIKAFYEGKKSLFDGLAISRYPHDWEPHPVLHIMLNSYQYNNNDSLLEKFGYDFSRWEKLYGIADTGASHPERFRRIIEQAYASTGRKVVILIDEYDKPILDAASDRELQDIYRLQLKSIYGNLKSCDQYIELAMLTGVSRFGKLSIFSDLNNLNDISMLDEFSAICGITLEEIQEYFSEGVEALATQKGLSVGDTYARLARNYDGYHFSGESPDIYNPFSLLSSLYAKDFGSYWFSTGTPSFLIEMIKREALPLKDFNNCVIDADRLLSVPMGLDEPLPILYQTGYLTIKGYDEEFDTVTLGYPNQEVERGFLKNLFEYYTPEKDSAMSVRRFIMDLRQGKTEDFMIRLQSLFSGYRYSQMDLGHLELHYRNVIYLVMKLMGFHTEAELQTASGRIDLLVGTPAYLYLFEFKVNRSAREAMAQINSRDYLLPFRADGRRIIKIGANFDDRRRTLSDWIIAE